MPVSRRHFIGSVARAVSVEWDGPVQPEPVGGVVFSRVVRSDDCVAVGVLDLTGSARGSWSEPTTAGKCRSVRVRLLLDAPERWVAAVATLGQARDRFVRSSFSLVEHRQGRAAQVEVPLASGWSVLRMTRAA